MSLIEPGELAELSEALGGRVVRPDGDDYHAARLVWNSAYDDARPAAVARVADAGDVRTVVEFCRDHGHRLIARSGGHSFAGYSTGEDLVVDLSGLTGATIRPDGETVTLGAGATLLPSYVALWPDKMAICGGTCPTVGIPGLTLGGGLGVLSRRYGLTCDTLVEADIVTADGRLVRASADENADLFWAMRGGGGGNFGIVTAFTFRLFPVDMPFTFADLRFPWEAAESLLTAWQSWLSSTPRGMWSAVEIRTRDLEADAALVALVELVHAGDPADADRAIDALVSAVGAKPDHRTSHSGPFVDVEEEIYCKGLRPKERALAEKTADGKLPRPALHGKSDVASGPWPAEGLAALCEWMERRLRDPLLAPHPDSARHSVGAVLLEPADGAVNEIAPDATAFVHRDNLFVSQYDAKWHPGASSDSVDANVTWLDGLYEAIEPYRSGFAYQNYIDRDLADWEHAYYGSNLDRLRRVKSSYDPTDFFRFPQSIRPAAPRAGA